MTAIICAFLSGFLVATLILWSIHRKQQKDWQAEYRRLMGGIKYNASRILIRTSFSREQISNDLMRLYNGVID